MREVMSEEIVFGDDPLEPAAQIMTEPSCVGCRCLTAKSGSPDFGGDDAMDAAVARRHYGADGGNPALSSGCGGGERNSSTRRADAGRAIGSGRSLTPKTTPKGDANSRDFTQPGRPALLRSVATGDRGAHLARNETLWVKCDQPPNRH